MNLTTLKSYQFLADIRVVRQRTEQKISKCIKHGKHGKHDEDDPGTNIENTSRVKLDKHSKHNYYGPPPRELSFQNKLSIYHRIGFPYVNMGSKTAENESQGGGSKSYTDRSPSQSADIWQMLLPAQPRRTSLVGNHEAPIGPGMVTAQLEEMEMEMTMLMGIISPALLPCR